MSDLRKAAEMALDALEDIFGKEKKDVGAINALRQALDLKDAIEKGTKAWADVPDATEWVEELRGNVDAVNMSQERVDETVKGEHETLYMDMSQVPTGMPDWKPGMVVPSPKREWVGLPNEKEILEISKDAWGRALLNYGRDDHCSFYVAFARAIETYLKEKNT